MVRMVQFCMGPAGSGKSTFCEALSRHVRSVQRGGCVLVNLDPAADEICYRPDVDIRDLVSLDDSLELRLGPNGGLVFCMEYLSTHLSWLRDALNAAGPGDVEHFIVDCPGQIELYTHVKALKIVIRALQSWGYTVCGTFLVDSAMVIGDISKYLSAIMLATSAMVQLEMPWVNVLSKVDLIPEEDAERFGDVDYGWVRRTLDDLNSQRRRTALVQRTHRLNNAVCSLLEDFSMVKFLPLDASDPDSVDSILQEVDMITQYAEELEPKEPRDELAMDDDNNDEM